MAFLVDVATWFLCLRLNGSSRSCGIRAYWTELVLLGCWLVSISCTSRGSCRLPISSEVINYNILVDDLRWGLEISFWLIPTWILCSQWWLSALLSIISSYLSISTICRLIIDAFESLSSTASIPTILSSLHLCSPSPHSIQATAHVLYLCHSPHHVRYLEVCPCIMTKVFSLRPVISLPSLTEWMIHTIVSEIVIFEIKVVEVVCTWLDLLSLQHSNQLWLCLLESDHDFRVFSNEQLGSS